MKDRNSQYKREIKQQYWERIGKTQDVCLCGRNQRCNRLYISGHNKSCLGKHWKLSKETCIKHSIARIALKKRQGFLNSFEARKKQGASIKGHSVSQETRDKISKSTKRLYRLGLLVHHLKGKHHSEETKRKIGLKSKGRYFSP
jgi:hypothetical protein